MYACTKAKKSSSSSYAQKAEANEKSAVWRIAKSSSFRHNIGLSISTEAQKSYTFLCVRFTIRLGRVEHKQASQVTVLHFDEMLPEVTMEFLLFAGQLIIIRCRRRYVTISKHESLFLLEKSYAFSLNQDTRSMNGDDFTPISFGHAFQAGAHQGHRCPVTLPFRTPPPHTPGFFSY